MNNDDVSIPTTQKALHAFAISSVNKIKTLEMNNAFLEERVRLLEHKLFGAKKETRKSQQELEQDSLFNETEIIAEKDAEHEQKSDPKTVVKEHERKSRAGRKPLPEALPRVERRIEIEEEIRICPHDGTKLERIGEEVSEKLNVVPAHIEVEKTIRGKYACPCCESYLITAPMPADPFPKSLATANTAAYVIVSKYADGLPLYRQSKMFERLGIELGRATLASWMIRAAEVLKPLYDHIRECLVTLPVLHCDETRLQVLREPGRAAETLSYMWAMASPYGSKMNAVYFEYHTGRSGKDAEHLLDGFTGTLICDGFDGYETLCARTKITRAGCMTHARRKFDEAGKASKKGVGVSNEFLDQIGNLYVIEGEIKDQSVDAKLKRRQKDSKPLLDELRKMIDKYRPGAPPQSHLGEALRYMDNEWEYLIRFADDGAVNIDNNRLENAIRPFAIGRKNWLFACTQNGAHASATLYTMVECAKLNGLNPYEYIAHLLVTLPALPEDCHVDDLGELMPWNWTPHN